MTSAIKRKATDLAVAEAKKPKANGNIASFFGAPKSGLSTTTSASAGADAGAGAGSTPAPVKFDKERWAEKLNAEQKELLKLEIDTLHESWLAHLKEEIVSKDFLELKRFLKAEAQNGKTVYPPPEDIYSWYVALDCQARP